MPTLDQLSVMLGTAVTRAVNSQLYDWIRAVSGLLDTFSNPQGFSQAAWFVDPVNGNDANDGSTQALALKTDARRQVLWGQSQTTVITQPTTVTYVSSPPASDIVNYDVLYKSGGSLTIKGLPTVAYRSVGILSTDLLWGDANAGVGVRVRSGGMMSYSVKPTINTPQGAGRQSLIGGVNTDWAAVPAVIAANNAMIVLEA